jgi:hypothetical protein
MAYVSYQICDMCKCHLVKTEYLHVELSPRSSDPYASINSTSFSMESKGLGKMNCNHSIGFDLCRKCAKKFGVVDIRGISKPEVGENRG